MLMFSDTLGFRVRIGLYRIILRQGPCLCIQRSCQAHSSFSEINSGCILRVESLAKFIHFVLPFWAWSLLLCSSSSAAALMSFDDGKMVYPDSCRVRFAEFYRVRCLWGRSSCWSSSRFDGCSRAIPHQCLNPHQDTLAEGRAG